jgi:hypothetical protein
VSREITDAERSDVNRLFPRSKPDPTPAGAVVAGTSGATAGETAHVPSDRFEHRPMKYTHITAPNLIYIGFDKREDFDKIDLPCMDHGENENGHVLTKSIDSPVHIVFQFWLKALTSEALIADMHARREKRALESN